MRKIPDIGADTDPCLAANGPGKPRADPASVPESVALAELGHRIDDVAEPLAQAIDAAHDAGVGAGVGAGSAATLPMSPVPRIPGRTAPAGATAPQRRKVLDPFEANPLQTAGGAISRPGRAIWTASVTVHVAFAVALLLLPERTAHDDQPVPIEIAFYSPDALQQPAPVPEPAVEAVVEPEPLPEPVVEATPPPAPEPEPVVAEVRPPEPRVVREPLPEPVPPPMPPPQVRTNVLSEAAPPPEPRRAPERTARLAGFARAETVATEQPEPTRQVARAGAFGAQATPPEDPPARRSKSRVVAAGRFANDAMPVPRQETAPARDTVSTAAFADEPAPAKPSRPEREREVVAGTGFASAETRPAPPATTHARDTVTSIGFDVATDTPAATAGTRQPGAVSRGGFGGGDVAAPAPRRRERPAEALDTPVEILAKTNPDYTDEARELRIEGEVVLEVLFDASGTLRVLRVIDGLGHGLDQAAMAAAKKIEFTPARRNGRPVDYTATLRVVFRLA